MNNNYKFCYGVKEDMTSIKNMFDKVFLDEEVGDLSVSITGNLPGLDYKNWYLYKLNNEVVAGLVQTLWNVYYEDIKLNVWEQAVVGTDPKHRGKNLVGKLNSKLDKDALENGIDFIIIQGIPGYYSRFGYRYAIDMENHINLSLDKINDIKGIENSFREATLDDFSLIKREDEFKKSYFLINNIRTIEHFKYHLGEGKNNDYASDYWISKSEEVFCRIQKTGFGDGLIISEISENISNENLNKMLSFLKYKALEINKPYIRFNLQVNSPVSKKLLNLGAKCEGVYGWQVKIQSPLNFLKKIKNSLEKRLSDSDIKDGIYQLSFGNGAINLVIEHKKITSINSDEVEANHTIFIPRDLFEPLALGFKSYSELEYCRPDLRLFTQEGESFINTLFPKRDSWLYNIW